MQLAEEFAAKTDEYVPVGHRVHVFAEVALLAELYVPAEHDVQLAEPAEDQVPGPQDMQEAKDGAAQAELNVPALHGMHVDALAAPVLFECVPGGHETQAPKEVAEIMDEYVPEIHFVQFAEADNDHVPAAHATHVADEFAANAELANPGAQAVQDAEEVAPVVALYVPGVHWVQLEAPAPDQVPAEQLLQTALEIAPISALAVPAGHGMHAEEEFAPETEE
eukprot:ANDGO_07698.mRNA.1 hypothetical protein H310_03517